MCSRFSSRHEQLLKKMVKIVFALNADRDEAFVWERVGLPIVVFRKRFDLYVRHTRNVAPFRSSTVHRSTGIRLTSNRRSNLTFWRTNSDDVSRPCRLDLIVDGANGVDSIVVRRIKVVRFLGASRTNSQQPSSCILAQKMREFVPAGGSTSWPRIRIPKHALVSACRTSLGSQKDDARQHMDAVLPDHGTVQFHVPGICIPPRGSGCQLVHHPQLILCTCPSLYF